MTAGGLLTGGGGRGVWSWTRRVINSTIARELCSVSTSTCTWSPAAMNRM